MTAAVVDYAWSHPSPVSLARVGYSGVMRYLSPDATKNLSVVERDQLQAQGLAIGLIWESTADRSLGDSAAGGADGASAAGLAASLGFPPQLPIYYAVDFDASESQLPVIERYLSAAGRSSGRLVGVYGSITVVDHMLNGGRASYGWQTVAWSRGRVSTIAHLYQRLSPTLPRVFGSYDENAVLRPDYGQWGGPTPPTPDHPPLTPHQPPIQYIDEETGETVHREPFDCGVLDAQGNAQIIWSGGERRDDGVASLAPAVAYEKFRGCFVKGRYPPADNGHTPAPGLPTWGPQERDGVVTIEFTGGVPGGKLDVELVWAD